MSYVNLHCHSDNSLLDGLSKPKQIAKRAKLLGYKAAACTDHGNLGSAPDFMKACKKEEKTGFSFTEEYAELLELIGL